MAKSDYKHREAVFQSVTAEIVRFARDLNELATSATRALAHPDVCRDPILTAMVRTFIAEQETALRHKEQLSSPQPVDPSRLRQAFDQSVNLDFPTRQQVLKAFLALQHDFEVQVAEFNEAAARYSFEKMRDLARRYPVHVDAAAVQRHEASFGDFSRRVATYRAQLEDVIRQATTAARGGDQKTAGWLLRRLRAVHALTPALLSAERFEQLRKAIEATEARQAHREALRGLIAREQVVADEIKRLGGAIYRFHNLAGDAPEDSEAYRRAEAAYRAAVEEVRARDTDWLTGLLLELENYLEDLVDPEARAQAQLDRFIGTVRTALTALRREIRAIRAERGAGSSAGRPVLRGPSADSRSDAGVPGVRVPRPDGGQDSALGLPALPPESAQDASAF